AILRSEAIMHRRRGRIREAPVFTDAAVQPFRRALRGLGGGRLNRDRLEVLALLLPLFGALADALAGVDDEQRDVIAAGLLGIENVVAEAEAIILALATEAKRVHRRRGTRLEKVYRVAVALGLEELPHRTDLHEARGFLLHLFHLVEEIKRLRLVCSELRLEVALVPEILTVEHERIDVAPNLAGIRHGAHPAIGIQP